MFMWRVHVIHAHELVFGSTLVSRSCLCSCVVVADTAGRSSLCSSLGSCDLAPFLVSTGMAASRHEEQIRELFGGHCTDLQVRRGVQSPSVLVPAQAAVVQYLEQLKTQQVSDGEEPVGFDRRARHALANAHPVVQEAVIEFSKHCGQFGENPDKLLVSNIRRMERCRRANPLLGARELVPVCVAEFCECLCRFG